MATYKKRLSKAAIEIKPTATGKSSRFLNRYNEDYRYSVNDTNDEININGRVYKVKDDDEFVVKVRKTFIGAKGGAKGLAEFFTDRFGRTNDIWERKIFQNTKPIRQEAIAKAMGGNG